MAVISTAGLTLHVTLTANFNTYADSLRSIILASVPNTMSSNKDIIH